MARKHNTTGIPQLSIGVTRNNRGYTMTRYAVNFKDPDTDRARSRSFYFGARQSQKDAFDKATSFMVENELVNPMDIDFNKVYEDYKHTKLI